MKMNKKHLYWIIPASVFVLAAVFYFLIPVFVKSYIHHKIEKYESEKNVRIIIDDLSVSNLHFNGDINVSMGHVRVVDNHCKDTFLFANQLEIMVDVLEKFHFQKKIDDIAANQINLHFIKNADYCNYRFLKAKTDSKEKESNYDRIIHRYLTMLTDYFPRQLDVKRMQVVTEFDSVVNSYGVQPLQIVQNQLTGNLTVSEGDTSLTHWKISGNVDKQNQQYAGVISLTEPGRNAANLPILKQLKNLNFKFQQLALSLNITDMEDENAHFQVKGSVDNLNFFHHYLSDSPVQVASASFALNVAILPRVVEVDSTSALILNHFAVHPYFRYEKAEKPHITFKLNEKNCDAKQLFGAFPDGVFQVVHELDVNGSLGFNVLFDCDFANIDSMKFDFNIFSADHTFSLGDDICVITRFNEPFEYTFYDHNEPVRTFTIGPDNPNFCPFANIPTLLTKSILVSEDPSFFSHRGFIKVSIRSAMIADLKAQRMIRGGSTITMQLVKNLFLNRKKLLSRKFEEMLLVWMIEDRQLISKERMFEIYVNIVEWGPNVNGIIEAARFYFDKKPQDLTLGESAYLATLIRAPKHYAGTLDEMGVVKDSRREEITALVRRMFDRGAISEAEFNSFNSYITTKIVMPEIENETTLVISVFSK